MRRLPVRQLPLPRRDPHGSRPALAGCGRRGLRPCPMRFTGCSMGRGTGSARGGGRIAPLSRPVRATDPLCAPVACDLGRSPRGAWARMCAERPDTSDRLAAAPRASPTRSSARGGRARPRHAGTLGRTFGTEDYLRALVACAVSGGCRAFAVPEAARTEACRRCRIPFWKGEPSHVETTSPHRRRRLAARADYRRHDPGGRLDGDDHHDRRDVRRLRQMHHRASNASPPSFRRCRTSRTSGAT